MRKTEKLEKGWHFILTEMGTKEMPAEHEQGWECVRVPHDWAIYGEFSANNDPQPLESSVLDYHENVIQRGRSGGLPIMGTGWYYIDRYISEDYHNYFLEFDGIMSRAEVFINGQRVGYRAYGYSSFSVDITASIKPGKNNRIVVKVNAQEKTSRWYPGAGLYREVRLVMTERDYVCYNGIWVKTEYVNDKKAGLKICCNSVGKGRLLHTVIAPDGISVKNCEGAETDIEIMDPKLWTLENPELYILMTEIYQEDQLVDRVYTRFGIRTISFNPDTGFSLNGVQTKINGVCMHHDFGMLGAAFNYDAALKQMKNLKEMGCNGLRTTHNPADPHLLDICDELGIVVMDEAFDEWYIPKEDNGYSKDFPEWAEIDLTDMIRRDRNHPCVVIYSIGNEVPDQTTDSGKDTCKWLTSICHREDSTRPVTCGFNRPDAAIKNGLAEVIDVIGINYNPANYERYHKEHPDWIIIASETVSAVSSRGEYYLPAVKEMPVVKHENLQVNSYDWSAVPFAYIPDIEFEAQKKYPFVCGCFVWTGYDYLGEPTPYREEWPSRSSYFGIFDLAGIRKDRYYAYAAQWGEKDILHILPHWNWEKGQDVDVHCYSNLDEVELFLNGKEIRQTAREMHRFIFEKIPFEPGELKAIAYKYLDGTRKKFLEKSVKTAGTPAKIHLICDKTSILADGKSIDYIEAQILDKDNNLCPISSNRVNIQVEGAGEYVASDAGDATCTRRFNESFCDAFHGKLMIAVRSKETTGYIVVCVTGENLLPATAVIEVREGDQ